MLITLWRSLTDPIGQRREIALPDLVRSFLSPKYSGPKDAAPGWSPASFRGDRRGRDHVEAAHALVLDYDAGPGLADVAWHWQRYRGIAHTTATHTAETPRSRVVLVLSRPVDADEYGRLYRWALTDAATVRHEPDRAPCDASRFWFVPIASAHYKARVLAGLPIDPDPILELLRPAPSPPQSEHRARANDWRPLVDEVRRAANGQRNAILFRSALRLASRSREGQLSLDQAWSELISAAADIGIGRVEAERTVRSAFKVSR